jgi:hypothetical protein
MDASIWVPIVISALSLAFSGLAATLTVIFRAIKHQTQIEDKLDNVIEDTGKLVVDKDRVHQAIYEQMRVDREATDKRLRYLEEFWISIGQSKVEKIRDE